MYGYEKHMFENQCALGWSFQLSAHLVSWVSFGIVCEMHTDKETDHQYKYHFNRY